MVAGTKAETVIAIIEKSLTNRTVTEITLDMKYGTIARNVFQMQLVLSTDSTFKTSFRSSARNKNQIPLSYRSGK
jgi:hypothetical protein